MTRIYLDYAAATPLDKRVLDVMLPFFEDYFHNPSALYNGARESKKSLESARESVAKTIGAKPSEIIFTAGGTESANLAVNGVMQTFPEGHLLISKIEHDAVLEPAKKYNHKLVNVDKRGILDLKDLESKINDKTVLISVMLVNNEIGTIQPIKEVCSLVSKIKNNRLKQGSKTPLYVHTDACQAPLYLDAHVKRLGVDMMTLNGGKIYGPKQSGVLFIKAGIKLEPYIRGGGQEMGYRSGTENVAFAVGFSKALELASRGMVDRSKKTIELRDYFISELIKKYKCELVGHKKQRIANNICVEFTGKDNERLIFALDELGVDAAMGSACSASNEESSHVLLALGKSDEQARSTLRFTLGEDTTKKELDIVLNKLKKALEA